MGRPKVQQVVGLVERELDLVPRVVASMASTFPRHVERAELLRAGTLGLVEAAGRYDASRGIPFDRFAARRIRGAVLDAMRAADWAPRAVRASARRADLVESSLTSRYGRSPSSSEVAAELGIDEIELRRIRSMADSALVGTLDRALSLIDDDGVLADAIVDDSQLEPVDLLERRELLGFLNDALDALPPRQHRVIVGYFVDGRRSSELAIELGVSESRISQMRTDALHSLRRSISGRYERSTTHRVVEARDDHPPLASSA